MPSISLVPCTEFDCPTQTAAEHCIHDLTCHDARRDVVASRRQCLLDRDHLFHPDCLWIRSVRDVTSHLAEYRAIACESRLGCRGVTAANRMRSGCESR